MSVVFYCKSAVAFGTLRSGDDAVRKLFDCCSFSGVRNLLYTRMQMAMIAFSILFLLATLPNVLPQDFLRSQFPLCGLTEVAARRPSKTACSAQLKTLHNAIRKHETWALRMLDSSGAPSNGFVWGNNYWLGTYSQCQWISSTKSLTRPSHLVSPPFAVGFYISSFKQNTSLQTEFDATSKDVIHLGLCLPSSCSLQELETLLNLWANQNVLTVQNLYNFTITFQTVRWVRRDFSWIYHPITIVLSVAMTATILLTLAGTIYDIYVWKPSVKRREIESNCRNNRPVEVFKTRNIHECADLLNRDNNLNNSYELKIDNSQHKSMPVHVTKAPEMADVRDAEKNVFAKLSLCFSAVANVKIILETSKDEFAIIHGIRFLGMIWLVWLYSVFYFKHYADNKPLAEKLSEGFSEHIISNSTFSVDTFFFTSGFSLAFKYYRNRRGSQKTDQNFSVKKKVNEFTLMALKRFLRLTPVYAVILAVVTVSVKSIRQTSLFEIQEPADETCPKYWWRNLFYINNLYEGNEMCMSWSWYLSADTQFFLLGVFILILSTRFWKFASFVAVSLVIASSLLTGYLSYGNGYTSSSRPQLALLHVIHFSPWTRIGPYLVGMLTGYFVVHLKGDLVLKKTILLPCWIVWFFCNVWVLFGLYNKHMSTMTTALHTALSRTAWGFGLSWIVIACCTKNAGAIKAVLSYQGWTAISKLSYSAYLISPLIITLITANAETAMHFDFFQLVVYFFGYLGIIYFSSFLLSLLLEIPLARLGRLVTGQKQAQNQLNQRS